MSSKARYHASPLCFPFPITTGTLGGQVAVLIAHITSGKAHRHLTGALIVLGKLQSNTPPALAELLLRSFNDVSENLPRHGAVILWARFCDQLFSFVHEHRYCFTQASVLEHQRTGEAITASLILDSAGDVADGKQERRCQHFEI